ncbi:MAG TPA: response regulator transcription factor [Ferruginibacter sp.]|nr:DNA-binding response regulator [Chitinophagaceae bacterium]HRI24873.1 response regulator transcription factor [Ferruginibacter sp.]
MKKFLLVDDHVVVRSGIKTLLTEMYSPAEVHEAMDGETAMVKMKENSYDLVMLDIQMPKTDTLGLMEYIHIKYPQAKVLMFSMSAENIYAKRFMKAGAFGFISKESPLEEITRAINMILNGKKYISDTLAEKLAEDSFSGKTGNPFNDLSPREFEIVSLLLEGKTVTDISHTLNIQTSTVGTHKARLFDKLGVTNILELKELATTYNL